MISPQRIAKKIFGTQNDRELKSIYPIVARINAFEPRIKPLTDDQLRAKTAEFKARVSKGEKLEAILPEAFAVVREAAWRVRRERHYDVQMIGGVTLHRGRIAEMRTGEGKTLVATLPAYLNALTGKGVHVITVNDYLARRDSEDMGKVHKFLGLDVGVIVHGLTDAQRQRNYGCDITYGTNNEFGFDYLRDNMKFRLQDYVQRELNFCIVDEVDSILIDEARTPLIISGPTDETTDLYYKIDEAIRSVSLVKETDYTIDEKSKTVSFTEPGIDKIEGRLGITNLFDPTNIEFLHHVNQGLRAHILYKRDVEYVVRDGQVVIVDEFTGRLMPGRRWSDGLHQAIEAKEGVTIENENQTLATITFQNYFRMYNKLSGMTGTADTEANEFRQIYKLNVSVIPTNRPMIRTDEADVIFKNDVGKYKHIAEEIKEKNAKGQPILVGTVSVEKSEKLSAMLKAQGVKHNVLNAKQHEREAHIIAEAGRKGAVTIATNMAGRGTDIILGGNGEALAKAEVGPFEPTAAPGTPEREAERLAWDVKLAEARQKWKDSTTPEREEVKQLGGLFILGTERHESRRIDNQLRGRAGRQGDPGGSRFYLSLEDDLMRIFGGTNIAKFMEDDLPIEHRWITKAIANAQKKVEGHNYDIRKHLLQYDDVMNQQRKVVYSLRKEVLASPALKDMIFSMAGEIVAAIAEDFFPGGKLRRRGGQVVLPMDELNDAVRARLAIPGDLEEKEITPFSGDGLRKLLMARVDRAYGRKLMEMGPEIVPQVERMILLSTIDALWKDHLLAMDHLREGVGLQGYGQKDPLIEYKKQGFKFFGMMMEQISGDVVRKLFSVQISPETGVGPEALGPNLDADDAAAILGTGIGARGPSAAAPMQYNLGPNGELLPPPGGATSAPGPSAAPAPRRAPLDLPTPRMPRQMTLSRGAPPPDLISAGPGGGGMPLPASGSSSGSDVERVGRNDVCPCGSGKKYKKCHGA